MRGEDAPTLAGGPRWWFLTMALAQSGEKEKARSYYDQLVKERDSMPVTSKQYDHFRDEAAEVLGIDGTESTKQKPEPKMHTAANAKENTPEEADGAM
jgi:hypothetical protein